MQASGTARQLQITTIEMLIDAAFVREEEDKRLFQCEQLWAGGGGAACQENETAFKTF